MRTDDEIKVIVEAAFRPLRCIAEVWGYDSKLRFKVFDDKDRGIVEVSAFVLRNLRDEAQLRDVLAGVRQRVVEKGYRVDPRELK